MSTSPSPTKPPRRRWPVPLAIALSLAAGAGVLLLRSGSPDDTSNPEVREDPDRAADGETTTSEKRAQRDPLEDAGPREFSLRVVFHGQPVPNALVQLVPLDAAHGALPPSCPCAEHEDAGAPDEDDDADPQTSAFECGSCEAGVDALLELAARGVGYLAESEVRTGADGVAHLTTGNRDVDLGVWIEAQGFRPASILPGGDDSKTVEVELQRKAPSEIVVENSDGEPIEDAELAIFMASPFRSLTRVLKGGKHTIADLPSGAEIEAVARAPGFLPQVMVIDNLDQTTEVMLERPCTLRGRVLHGDAPVAGAKVHLSGGLQDVEVSVKSDREGRFSFPRLGSGDYALEGTLGALHGETEVNVMGDNEAEVALQVTEYAKITGTLTEVASGKPIASGTIELIGSEGSFATADSDEAGHYELPTAPGSFNLRAFDQDHVGVDRPVTVAEGQQLQVDVALPSGTQVLGRVIDSRGQPIEGARIALEVADHRDLGDETRMAHSDAEGKFSLKGIREGGYVLTVEAEGHPAHVQPLKLPLASVEVRMMDGASIEGQVIGPDGPLAEAHVTAASDGRHEDTTETTSDAHGHFHLGGLAVGGVSVVAVASGLAASEPAQLQVREGEVSQLDLHLTTGLEIHGRVEDDRGRPIVDAMVEAYADTAAHAPLPGRNASSTSDSDGHFVLAGLRDGTYRLSAYHDALTAGTPVPVSAGAHDVVIQLARSGKVTGRVISSSGVPARRFTVEGEEFHSADGQFTLREIAPDSTEIFIDGPFPTIRVPVEVRPGQTIDVGTVTFEDGASIVGHVLTTDGRPAGGAEVTAVPNAFSDDGTVAEATVNLDSPRTMVADAQGHFVMDHLRNGIYMVQATTTAGGSNPIRVTAGGPEVELVLQAGASLVGRVALADGTPVDEGMAIYGSGGVNASARVASGVFALQGLPAGQGELIFTGFSGGGRVTAVQAVSLSPGQELSVEVTAAPRGIPHP